MNLNGIGAGALTCLAGEKICWGAWDKGNSRAAHWGVGSGREACTSCCYVCNGQTASVRLNNAGNLVRGYLANVSRNRRSSDQQAVGALLNGFAGALRSYNSSSVSRTYNTVRPPLRYSPRPYQLPPVNPPILTGKVGYDPPPSTSGSSRRPSKRGGGGGGNCGCDGQSCVAHDPVTCEVIN